MTLVWLKETIITEFQLTVNESAQKRLYLHRII